MSSQDDAASSMNVTGTDRKIDAPMTREDSPDVHGWQPIESAPKNGEPMLLWLKKPADRNWTVKGICDHYAIGFWQHGRWQSIEVEDAGSMGGEETGWMSDWCSIDLDPAHWMPLPDPPVLPLT